MMLTVPKPLAEISYQMQTFDDLEHTSRSLTACIYYEISVRIWRIMKKKKNIWWTYYLNNISNNFKSKFEYISTRALDFSYY